MRPKILLVEDDANLVELIRYNLDKEGFDVVTTPDGEEALVLKLVLAEADKWGVSGESGKRIPT